LTKRHDEPQNARYLLDERPIKDRYPIPERRREAIGKVRERRLDQETTQTTTRIRMMIAADTATPITSVSSTAPPPRPADVLLMVVGTVVAPSSSVASLTLRMITSNSYSSRTVAQFLEYLYYRFYTITTSHIFSHGHLIASNQCMICRRQRL